MRKLLLAGDGYKYSIHKMISPDVESAQFYFGTRDKPYFAVGINQLLHELSQPITHHDIDWALERVSFDEQPWRLLVDKYNGYLPIEIQTVAEGTWCDKHSPCLVMNITDPDFVWLGMYLEATIYHAIWYMSTVATKVRHLKSILEANNFHHPFVPQYNRGAKSLEQAAKASAAYSLVYDHVDHQAHYLDGYNFNKSDIRANHVAEHMVILVNGENYSLNWIEVHSGAIMYDTFDKLSFLDKIKHPNKLCLLADDGDLAKEMQQVAELIKSKFGYYPTICQLDNVDVKEWTELVQLFNQHDMPNEQVIFADDYYTAHHVTRDTLGFAYKVCSVNRNGERLHVAKHNKDSAKGTLKGFFKLPYTVFKDGQILHKFTVPEIRSKIANANYPNPETSVK